MRQSSLDLAPEGEQESLDLLATFAAGARDWVIVTGPEILLKAVTLLVLILLSCLASRLAARLVGRAMDASRLEVSDLFRDFTTNVSRKAVLFLGSLFAISAVGIPVGPFLAAFGAVGIVAGFALSETLNNFAAGLMILLYRPYDLGDSVDAGGVKGKVEAMTLVSTSLLTPDNQRIIVPNGSIWGGRITNVTANPKRRLELVIGIGYEDDIEQAESVLTRICEAHEKVDRDPAPLVRLNELADSSVNFIVRVWTNTGDYGSVRWDLLRSIKLTFDREGISFPYPQRDVHLLKSEA